jgi:SNF2 family DNA or RNA helicase
VFSQNFIEMELRKCCNHPFLLRGVDEREVGNMTSLAQRREHLIRCSGKMVFLDKLLTKLKSQGKKVRGPPVRSPLTHAVLFAAEVIASVVVGASVTKLFSLFFHRSHSISIT